MKHTRSVPKGKHILKYLLTSFLALSIALLTACGSSSSNSGSASDTITMGMVNPPATFDPINAADIAGQFAGRLMFDTFLDQTAPLKFVPKLADSITTADNQNYTIKLNPKAKWTDGKPVTADDVIFTFNLIANPKTETAVGSNISVLEGLTSTGKFSAGITSIPDLTKVDAHTVTFKTKKPIDPNYVKELIGTKIVTLPQHILKNIAPQDLANSKYMQSPNVTDGPYKFVTYSKNAYIQYQANNSYYLGKPKTPKFFLKIMQAPNLASELQAGTIQMNAAGGIGIIPVQDYKTVKGLKNVKTITAPQIGYQTMMFNTKTITNPQVRLAFAHAINRQQIVSKLLQGNGQIVDGPYTSVSPYLDKDLPLIKYDPALAKQMLKDAGWDFNKTVNLVVPIGNQVRQQSGDIIAQNLKAVGVKVSETTYDFPTVMQKGKAGQFDLLLIGFGGYVDPDQSAYYGPNGVYNFMKYDNPQSTSLLQAGLNESNPAKRKVIYNQLQQIWDKDMPILTLYSDNQMIAIDNNIAAGGASTFWPGTVYNFQNWTYKSGK